MMSSKRSNEEIVRYKAKIGCHIEIPNIGRGQLKFVGSVDNKPGYYAGVDLLTPIGKNNGTFNGRRYFNTEYPKSGLFIQLPKIAHILDEMEVPENLPTSARRSIGSRRSTLGGHSETLGNTRRISGSSGSSIERLSMRRTQSPRLPTTNHLEHNVRTPTPTRNINMTQRVSSIERHSMVNINTGNNDDVDMEMGGTTPERNNYDHSNVETIAQPPQPPHQQTNDHHSVQLIKEYELKLEKQNRKLLEYERLLNDQRIVLEEIQPTIDEYDKRVNDLELEKNTLKEKLQESQVEFDKQLKYFETENKQLTDVVSQLHEDLRSNEEYIQQQTANATSTINTDGVDINELQTQLESLIKYKQDMENAQAKWNKEKDQLKMHNESLSKEYQTLNKEYMLSLGSTNNNDSSSNEKIMKENETLKNELQSLRDKISQLESTSHSIPPYIPPTKVDATAGRELWCSLCEKSGHDQIDCPYQYETSNRPHGKNDIAQSTESSNSQQYF